MPVAFFFFQAEDGIRDLTVTGVQTCALPIWKVFLEGDDVTQEPAHLRARRGIVHCPEGRRGFADLTVAENLKLGEIGRASWRERVEIPAVAVSLKKKNMRDVKRTNMTIPTAL